MKNKTVIEQMNSYINKCAVMGVHYFDFYYNDDDDIVCVTEIYVPDNDPEPFIHIPSFVSYLHYSVVCDNKKLASCKIFIPKECSIEWNYGSWECGRKQDFFACAKEIIIEDGHPDFSREDGVLFNGDKTEVLLYPAEKGDEEYTVPESVISIDIDAFLGNEYLRRLNISSNLRKMEKCKFDSRIRIEVDANNKALKSVDGSVYSKNGKKAYHLFTSEEGLASEKR